MYVYGLLISFRIRSQQKSTDLDRKCAYVTTLLIRENNIFITKYFLPESNIISYFVMIVKCTRSILFIAK